MLVNLGSARLSGFPCSGAVRHAESPSPKVDGKLKSLNDADANFQLAKRYYLQWDANASQQASEKVIESGDKKTMLEHAEWCLSRSHVYSDEQEKSWAQRTLALLGNTLTWEDVVDYPNLKEMYKALPHLKIPLYSDSHYSFFSMDTHAVSGWFSLSSTASTYVQKKHIDSVCDAMYCVVTGHSKRHYSNSTVPFTITNVCEVPLHQGKRSIEEVVAGMFPSENASKEEVIAFYETNRSIEFSTNERTYEIKPVLLHDIANDRYYFHIELGNKETVVGEKCMLNFCGNGIGHSDQILTAAKLFSSTGTKQIIPMYPNKGINSVLNPDLIAATVSIKGSMNPHLVAYNHLAPGHKLEIYAHSYGNLASAQFINAVKDVEPDKAIYFIGSTSAASLEKIAQSWVGTLAVMASPLLDQSDVVQALGRSGVTSIIFNDVNDKVIAEDTQIHRHVKNLKKSSEHGGVLQNEHMTVKLLKGDISKKNHYDCINRLDEFCFDEIYQSKSPWKNAC